MISTLLSDSACRARPPGAGCDAGSERWWALFDDDARQLRVRVLRLERRVETLLGIVRLLFVLVRLTGLREPRGAPADAVAAMRCDPCRMQLQLRMHGRSRAGVALRFSTLA